MKQKIASKMKEFRIRIAPTCKSLLSILIFAITFVCLLIMTYLLKKSHFYIFLIEVGYAIAFSVPFYFIVGNLSKTRHQFYLIALLGGLSGYTALFASLMTKITPILSQFDFFPLIEIIYLTIIGLINIISYLYLIFLITNKKLLKPLREMINKKEMIESELRSQKRELSMFNRIIAHDIKNHLSNIKGYSQLFIKDQDNYRIIKRQITQIQELLENSLKLANAGKVIDKKEPVDLNQLIRGIIKDFVPKNVEVSVQHIPMVLGDRQKLRQALKNILENGVIHGRPKSIEVTSKFKEEALFVRICDDGDKISTNIIKNFSSEEYMVDLKSKHLGLKIIKRIINAHGWEITIKNDPFTTYIIRIPEQYHNIDK